MKQFQCDQCGFKFTLDDCEVKEGQLIHKCPPMYEIVCDNAEIPRKLIRAHSRRDAALRWAEQHGSDNDINTFEVKVRAYDPMSYIRERFAEWDYYKVTGEMVPTYKALRFHPIGKEEPVSEVFEGNKGQ